MCEYVVQKVQASPLAPVVPECARVARGTDTRRSASDGPGYGQGSKAGHDDSGAVLELRDLHVSVAPPRTRIVKGVADDPPGRDHALMGQQLRQRHAASAIMRRPRIASWRTILFKGDACDSRRRGAHGRMFLVPVPDADPGRDDGELCGWR
jgi:hypothetical protein